MEEKDLYEFGPYRLDVEERNLTRSDGVQNGLLPEKAFNALALLVRRSGDLVTKQELIQEIWPDAFVEENNLDKCIHAIRHVIGEKPGENKYIETVRKRGYRFVGKVRRIQQPIPAEIDPTPSAAEMIGSQNSRRWRLLLAAGLMLLLISIFLLDQAKYGERISGPAIAPQIRSLAVLPLRSLNRAAQEHHLGLGISDTIIAKLSRDGRVTVRPTSAVRKYAEQEIDSLEAGKQLQADAVLEGTFMHTGERLRVNFNLLRVSDGASLWDDNFEVGFTDIFATQNEVSSEVAERLSRRLNLPE